MEFLVHEGEGGRIGFAHGRDTTGYDFVSVLDFCFELDWKSTAIRHTILHMLIMFINC